MSQPFNFHNMRLLFCHSTVNLFLVMLHRRTGKWTTKSRQQLAECSKVFPFSTSHAFLAAVEFLTKHGDWLTLFLFIYFYHFFSVAPFGILTKYTFSYYIIYKHISHKIWRMWLHGVFVAIDKVAVLHHSIPSVHSWTAEHCWALGIVDNLCLFSLS